MLQPPLLGHTLPGPGSTQGLKSPDFNLAVSNVVGVGGGGRGEGAGQSRQQRSATTEGQTLKLKLKNKSVLLKLLSAFTWARKSSLTLCF